ncbi:hypothetical protein GCM10028795_18810 [Lysobacter olei]
MVTRNAVASDAGTDCFDALQRAGVELARLFRPQVTEQSILAAGIPTEHETAIPPGCPVADLVRVQKQDIALAPLKKAKRCVQPGETAPDDADIHLG